MISYHTLNGIKKIIKKVLIIIRSKFKFKTNVNNQKRGCKS